MSDSDKGPKGQKADGSVTRRRAPGTGKTSGHIARIDALRRALASSTPLRIIRKNFNLPRSGASPQACSVETHLDAHQSK